MICFWEAFSGAQLIGRWHGNNKGYMLVMLYKVIVQIGYTFKQMFDNIAL